MTQPTNPRTRDRVDPNRPPELQSAVAATSHRLSSVRLRAEALSDPPFSDLFETLRGLYTRRLEPGQHFDKYQIVRLLGRGGSSSVYLADQVEPMQRQVAIKIVDVAAHSPRSIESYSADVGPLAQLNHPFIAKVYEVGFDDDGLSFVVIEYVPGLPIVHYCDSNNVGFRERLSLFRDVCSAVEHAHQRNVLHRDLKPENILCYRDGQTLIPKVIDFGLAHTLQGNTGGSDVSTAPLAGTRNYISPENLRDNTSYLDVRTDVYALGVVLYQLMLSSLPFSPEADPDPAALEGDLLATPTLQKASERARSIFLRGADLPARGRMKKRALLGVLASDLDWIIARALEQEPDRRYPSVAALSQDVDAALRNEPVQARPFNRRYVVGKYVSRHRAAAIGAGLFVAASTAGIGGITHEHSRAMSLLERLRDTATALVTRSGALADSPGHTLAKHDLASLAAAALDSGTIDRRDQDILLVRSEASLSLARLLGDPYGASLNDNAGAIVRAAEAVELARSSYSISGLSTAATQLSSALLTHAILLQSKGRLEEAASDLREAARVLDTAENRTNAVVAQLLSDIWHLKADIYSERAEPDSARDFTQRAYDLRISLLAKAPDDPEKMRRVSASLQRLALTDANPVRARETVMTALSYATAAYALAPQSYATLLDISYAYRNVGHVLRRLNRPSEGLGYYVRALGVREMLRRTDPSDSRMRHLVADMLNFCGETAVELGAPTLGVRCHRAALAEQEALANQDHPPTWLPWELQFTNADMARAFRRAEKPDSALYYYDAALAKLDPSSSLTVESLRLWKLWDEVAEYCLGIGETARAATVHRTSSIILGELTDLLNPVSDLDSAVAADLSYAWNADSERGWSIHLSLREHRSVDDAREEGDIATDRASNGLPLENNGDGMIGAHFWFGANALSTATNVPNVVDFLVGAGSPHVPNDLKRDDPYERLRETAFTKQPLWGRCGQAVLGPEVHRDPSTPS